MFGLENVLAPGKIAQDGVGIDLLIVRLRRRVVGRRRGFFGPHPELVKRKIGESTLFAYRDASAGGPRSSRSLGLDGGEAFIHQPRFEFAQRAVRRLKASLVAGEFKRAPPSSHSGRRRR